MKNFLLILFFGFILSNCKLSGTETGNPDPKDSLDSPPAQTIDDTKDENDDKNDDKNKDDDSSEQSNLLEFPESLCQTLSLCYFESVPLNCIESIHHSKNLTTTLGFDAKTYPTLFDVFEAIDEDKISYDKNELKNCLGNIKEISCDLMDLLVTLNSDHSIDLNFISFLTQFIPQCLNVASPKTNDSSE